MKILAVDIGTGTQDIFLYDARLDPENGFKLVAPAPTMMRRRQIQEATRRGQAIALSGRTMGGGPSHWAVEDHLAAGYPVYATAAAARSFNDDLEVIREMGIELVGEEEIRSLPGGPEVVEMGDFDFPAIARAFGQFGLELDDLAAVTVAVFDHGAAPADISDRQFRFDYITRRLLASELLSTFAFTAEKVPPIMTRMQAVVESAKGVDAPLVIMDTAPAAVLGSLLDPAVSARERQLVTNVGNFHTIAFRLHNGAVEGVFEHHTGMLDRPKLDGLLQKLAAGTLTHRELFDDNGHGALITNHRPMDLTSGDFGLVVTGPRRAMQFDSVLRPYFAAPFGDMMLTGCFGLLAAVADVLPELGGTIWPALMGQGTRGRPPWELE
jgi:uncharacterized protein (DUF1786 family)